MSNTTNTKIIESIIDDLRDFNYKIKDYIDLTDGIDNKLNSNLREIQNSLINILN
jgi:hypothetical protein